MRLLCLLTALFSVLCAEEPWIIDPHTHFKGEAQIAMESIAVKRDPRNTLGMVLKPEDYRDVAKRLGIQATLVVEAVDQDKPQFNDWVLEQAKSDVVCGYVGRGDLTKEDFWEHHERYRKTGYLNGYRFRMDELSGYLDHELAKEHLKKLEKQGMVIDLLIDHPSTRRMLFAWRGNTAVLKVILNHCLRARMKDGKISDEWKEAVAECGKEPNIYCKISSIVNFADVKAFEEPAPTDLEHYLPVLDPCFEAFGEDRVHLCDELGCL